MVKNKTILFIMSSITWNRVPVIAALSKSDKFDIKFIFQQDEKPVLRYSYDERKLFDSLIQYLEKNNVCFSFKRRWRLLNYLLTEDYDALVVGEGWGALSLPVPRTLLLFAIFLFLITTIRRKKLVFNAYDSPTGANLKPSLVPKTIALLVGRVTVSGKRQAANIKYWGFKDKDITIITQCSQVWMFSESFVLKRYFQNRETFKIGFLGRCHDEIKGIKYLKEAFEILSRKFENIELFLVGYESNKVSKNVYQLKALPPEQIHHFYKNIDLVVLPSIEKKIGARDAWGYIINEAYQFGLPAITTNMVGCVDDIVKNHENGFVVKEKDAKDLAEKIEILIKDAELYEKISNNNKALFNEKLTLEKNIKAWEDFLGSL